MTEKRALQIAVLIACLVPFVAGGGGMIGGQATFACHLPFLADLDSHLRYLSGLLFAIGLGFLSCVPGIERKGERMTLLSGIVLIGGLARLTGVAIHGLPGPGHIFGLVMECGVVPALWLWQRRVAARLAEAS